jgi:hypothetical protein
MFASLDIFKIISGDEVLWRGAAETFVAAKLRIQRLALSSPGDYLILNQHTGDRVRFTVEVAGDIPFQLDRE